MCDPGSLKNSKLSVSCVNPVVSIVESPVIDVGTTSTPLTYILYVSPLTVNNKCVNISCDKSIVYINSLPSK